MKKSIIRALLLFTSILLLSSCKDRSKHELSLYFDSRPATVTMPYNNPRYLIHQVPDQLPISFIAPANGELFGTVEADGHESGTILMKVDQSASDILEYYTHLFTGAGYSDASKSYNYQVFFPPEENGATFCSEQGVAIILEIFDSEDGLKDVRLHYTTDKDVIERTTCGQPILAIEDFPFPYLAAPPNSIVVGGGGGGGGSGTETRRGPLGYSAKIVINSDDSLESVYNHYVDMIAAEGWILLSQSSTEHSLESSWDFGFYEIRSWLAHLITSAGDAPNEYVIELRAVSP
jgi:hypothetical protein